MARNFELNPGFIGIGAARAGTTWLHANLRRHPEIWLPPVKELHYFDLQRPGARYYYPIAATDVNWMQRDWKMGPAALRRMCYYRQTYGLVRRLPGRVRLRWALRYIFGFRNDRWYQQLFRKDRLSGEITPGYMLLPPEVVAAVHQLNPAMKIILLLRNPVSRAWSLIRQYLGERIVDASDEELLRLAGSEWIVKRGDYVGAINTWRQVFGEKQLFIGFFDDLVAKPRELLHDILQFLEVEAGDQYIPNDIERVVNASARHELPERLLPRMYGTYLAQLRELEPMLGGPVSKWRAKAEEALRAAAPVPV